MNNQDNQFLLRRLHAISGLIPLGMFLFVHMTMNFQATKGAEAYNAAAEFMTSLPFVHFLELSFIFIPLVFHGGYGLYIAFQAKNNVGTYSTSRNWRFFIQRVTGIIMAVFLIWHIWETKAQIAWFGEEASFAYMQTVIGESLFTTTMYIIGVVATAYHFANGLFGLAIKLGLAVSESAQRRLNYILIPLFVVILTAFVMSVMAFV